MYTQALLLLCISCLKLEQVDAAGALRRVSSGGVLYASAPQERGAYAVGGSRGQSHYGYNTGTGIAKVEVRQPNGAVVGSYRYFDPNGKQVVRSYIADSKGFRVLGNDLPISPDTPASKVLGEPALTAAFEGTSEYDIPPPLFKDNSQRHQVPDIIKTTQQNYQQFDNNFSQRQQEYDRHHQQLEQQREALRIQQEKLEALQRQIESQQISLSNQYSIQTPQNVPQRRSYSSSSLQEQNPYYPTTNTLTGGITSPYLYYKEHLNYDFPAGFAYQGLPVTRSQPVRRGCYPGSKEPGCGSSYIIGRAR